MLSLIISLSKEYPTRMINKIEPRKKVVIGISLVFLIISLTQPAFYTANDSQDALNLSSAGIFFLGWMGIFSGAVETIFWIANPLYILALFLFIKNNKKGVLVSIASSVLAISFTMLNTFFANEGGGRVAITGYGLGYYFWVSSLCSMSIGMLLTEILVPNNKFSKRFNVY